MRTSGRVTFVLPSMKLFFKQHQTCRACVVVVAVVAGTLVVARVRVSLL